MANNLDYAVNLGGGTPAKKKQTSLTYSDNLLGGAIKDPRVPEAPPIPTPANLSYQGNMGGFGGVTDEGAIIGNPNVERMPYIREKTDTSYSANLMGKAVTSPVTPPVAMSYSAQQSTEQQAPTQQQENAPATGTGGGAPIDSYEEFLMKQEGFYKEQLDKINAQIEQNKQNAIQQAEQERQRGVIDARSSHEQNRATYGANAEMLAGMGLSGSGYSEYLDQQAYATQRAETQSANAQSQAVKQNAEQQANSDKLNAELSYTQNMQNNAEKLAQYQQKKEEEAKAAEEQKKQYYAMLLTSANTGEYTSEQIAKLAAQYGFDEAQIAELQGAADKYKSDQQAATYAQIMDKIANEGSAYEVSYLDTMLDMGSITQKQYDDLKAKYDKVVDDELQYEVDQGLNSAGSTSETVQATIDNVEKYYAEGKITNEQRQNIQNNYMSGVVKGVSNPDDYFDVKKQLDEYKNSGKISDSQYGELVKSLYGTTTKRLDNSQYTVKGLGKFLVDTDDIDVVIDGKRYDLVSGHITNDSTKKVLNEAATGNSATAPSTGTIIVFCGEMYIYKKSRKGTNWHKMGNDSDKVADAIQAYNRLA